MDHNVLTTLNSLKIAERGQKKELKASFAQSDTPKDMRIPDLGVDEDIKNATESIGEAQKETGKKIPATSFGQLPVQYAQSAGVDSDIADATSSISFAEKKLNHKLTTERLDDSKVAYNQKW
jgi:hypothetical protein